MPVISIVIGNSFGAANYASRGHGFAPRFIFSWPMSKCAVMGPDQLSGVLRLLSIEGAKKKGLPFLKCVLFKDSDLTRLPPLNRKRARLGQAEHGSSHHEEKNRGGDACLSYYKQASRRCHYRPKVKAWDASIKKYKIYMWVFVFFAFFFTGIPDGYLACASPSFAIPKLSAAFWKVSAAFKQRQARHVTVRAIHY